MRSKTDGLNTVTSLGSIVANSSFLTILLLVVIIDRNKSKIQVSIRTISMVKKSMLTTF